MFGATTLKRGAFLNRPGAFLNPSSRFFGFCSNISSEAFGSNISSAGFCSNRPIGAFGFCSNRPSGAFGFYSNRPSGAVVKLPVRYHSPVFYQKPFKISASSDQRRRYSTNLVPKRKYSVFVLGLAVVGAVALLPFTTGIVAGA